MKSVKKIFVLFAFAAFVFSVSSCNRGYGCPSWSLDEATASIEVLEAFLPAIP